MKMYRDYIKELRGDELIETEQGFATYRFINDGKSVYIIDIYVKPEFRKTRAATEMADQIADIAKEIGCTEMIGTVVPACNGSTMSMKVLLGYGMTLQSATSDFIIFRKDL